MARLWIPDIAATVGSREPVGRRLFAVPRLAGASDQMQWKDTLEIDHFLEKRLPGAVSLDRLGEKFVDGKVKTYLLIRAQHAGTRFMPPKDFSGWAYVRADKLAAPGKGLKNYPVVASPIVGDPQSIDCNPYHAHVCRPCGETAYTMAMTLRQLFHDHGNIEWVKHKPWWWKFWRYAVTTFKKAFAEKLPKPSPS